MADLLSVSERGEQKRFQFAGKGGREEKSQPSAIQPLPAVDDFPRTLAARVSIGRQKRIQIYSRGSKKLSQPEGDEQKQQPADQPKLA